MKIAINTDKIVDNVVSEALERKIDGKTIKQWMAEIAKHKWISVKDRLPEKEGQYLCWVHINKVHFCYQIHLWYSGAWRWANNNVLYWMPLPEAPKEDNK